MWTEYLDRVKDVKKWMHRDHAKNFLKFLYENPDFFENDL